MNSEKPPGHSDASQLSDEQDQDLQMARRALLRAAVYTAPVIVGSVVVTSHAQAQASCMPNDVCMPWDNCIPQIGCRPDLGCMPNEGCMPDR